MERQDAKPAKNAKVRNVQREASRELDALAHTVIGAAIEVHRQLGPGFLEHVYEEAMVVELTERRIPFQRQVTFPVYYKRILVAESRLDLLVAEQIVVELKAVEELRLLHHGAGPLVSPDGRVSARAALQFQRVLVASGDPEGCLVRIDVLAWRSWLAWHLGVPSGSCARAADAEALLDSSRVALSARASRGRPCS